MFDGVANVAPLERLAARVARFRREVRMPVAGQKVARAVGVAREVLGQALARPLLRLERGRRFDQPALAERKKPETPEVAPRHNRTASNQSS